MSCVRCNAAYIVREVLLLPVDLNPFSMCKFVGSIKESKHYGKYLIFRIAYDQICRPKKALKAKLLLKRSKLHRKETPKSI